VHVEFCPAHPGHGIVFERIDCNNTRIPASVRYRTDIALRTNLSRNGVCVEMIEHVLAALAGLQIDNCTVRVNSAEMPGLDGSCGPFVELLEGAGVTEQSEPRHVVIVNRMLRVGHKEAWVEIAPSPRNRLSLEYFLDYGPQHVIPGGTFGGELTPQFFRQQLASARTFILQSEADELRSHGYGERVDARDLLLFTETGLTHNTLRFPDECVRHKALDLVGDLALAGCDLWGHVRAYRSGHRLNAALVQRILDSQAVSRRLKRTA